MPVINEKVSMWVPTSHQDRQAALVNKAVREYDPDLGFGLNEATGQWCIFLKHGATEMASEADLPILGFSHIPNPDDAVKRLYDTDARRRGREILDAINRNNKDIEDAAEQRTVEATEQAAEAFEWAFRKEGKAPISKVYMPGGE